LLGTAVGKCREAGIVLSINSLWAATMRVCFYIVSEAWVMPTADEYRIKAAD